MEVSMINDLSQRSSKSTQRVPLSFPPVEERLEHEVLLLCDPCGRHIYIDWLNTVKLRGGKQAHLANS